MIPLNQSTNHLPFHDDVKRAIELGSGGILVASGIVKSRNWNRDIEGFAKAIL